MLQSVITRSAIGVALFWESGAQRNIKCEKRITTVKIAIAAKVNIQVERLLTPQPTTADLDYLKNNLSTNHHLQIKQPQKKDSGNRETLKENQNGKASAKQYRT